MEDFRRQFLLEAAAALKITAGDLQNEEKITGIRKQEISRTLHTIKGTAQTFGFASASRLAHELENILSVAKDKNSGKAEELKSFFREGIGLLIKSLEQENFEFPNSFIEKIRSRVPDSATVQYSSGDFTISIPDEFLSQLSVQEKNSLGSALQNGKNIFCLEVAFGLETFADELIKLREALNSTGEIIATMPGAKSNGSNKIGFCILFATSSETSKIKAIAEENAAQIIFDSSLPKVFSNDATGVLEEIVRHGQETAKSFGKQIRFETSANETNLPADKLKVVFEILLHLVRNAVDHAIETSGKIEIHLKSEDKGLRLVVSDDGRGIDLKRVKTKAIEKNLISADKNLTEQQTIDLIFLPEFSTKSSITEISGRGVGLDAVKAAAEKIGGKIAVRSSSGKGTTFEIFLPR
jgi:chemotaxis protein histidine kinase CheA